MDGTDPVIVVGMTGASGQAFGATAVELLDRTSANVHLVLSRASVINLRQEGGVQPAALREMADETYTGDDEDAPIADPSFESDGVIVAPCSMKTLAGVAHGADAGLIATVATNQLDRGRPVVLMPREKPLNLIHLRNMRRASEAGGRILPPNLETSGFDAAGTVDDPIRSRMQGVLEAVGI